MSQIARPTINEQGSPRVELPWDASPIEEERLARHHPSLSLISETQLVSRPWFWPFQLRRLITVRALLVASIVLSIGLAIRVVMATTLWLGDDEAAYWTLSRHLQLSYAVHPPLSIWLIRLLSSVLGNNLLGVRSSAILSATLGSFWLVRLSARMGWAKGADAVALLSITTPIFLFGGFFAGPDLPLFALWAGMMETSYILGSDPRNEREREARPKQWLYFGLLTGLALLSKYTAVLAVASCGLWLATTPAGRRSLKTRWPYISLAIAAACFSPVVIWNAKNDWVSFQFQFWSRHVSQMASPNIRREIVFWLSQAVVLGPGLVYGWFALCKHACVECLSEEPDDLEERFSRSNGLSLNLKFLACWALTPALVFFIQPLFSDFKVHWALYAFLPVMLYFSKLSASNLRATLLQRTIATSTTISLVVVASLYLPITANLKSGPEAKYDVTNDFYGWNDFNQRMRGLPPSIQKLPLLTSRYQLASQAAFALGSIQNIFVYPRTSAEVQDWPGVRRLPKEFLHLSDNRYADDPKGLYPTHRCTPLDRFSTRRAGLVVKSIDLSYCLAKAL